MKKFGLYLIINIGVQVIRWLTFSLGSIITEKLEQSNKSFCSVLKLSITNVIYILNYIAYAFPVLSIIYAFNIPKVLFWIVATGSVILIVLCSFMTLENAVNDKIQYGYGNGYCFGVWLVSLYPARFLWLTIYTVFETLYSEQSSIFPSLIMLISSIALFIFSIYIAVQISHKSKYKE